MACGSCGKRAETSDFLITWGDGETLRVGSMSAVRIALAQQTDPVKKRKAMYRMVPKLKTA